MDRVGCTGVPSSRLSAGIALAVLGAMALMLVPSGAQAQKKKLKIKIETSSQTQALNQGTLKVSYKSKGLDKLSATAKATPTGGSQLNFASKAQRNNPGNGTLSLPLTNTGEAALEECDSLRVRVQAKGKPSRNANASRLLAEDDPVCAEPVREFPLETSAAYPTGIDVGPDDALWIAQMGAGASTIGRMTTAGEYSMFHVPVPEGAPPDGFSGHLINDVVAGPDGGIWAMPQAIFGGGSSFARRLDPATGNVTTVDIGAVSDVAGKMAVGPDDAIWLAITSPRKLVRVTTDGDVTDFPLTDPAHPEIDPIPYGVAAGGDGGVWFTTPGRGSAGFGSIAAVGRLDPTSGETELFPLTEPDKGLGFMTADRAGRLWFTTPVGNTIGRIDPDSSQIVEFEIPTPNSGPVGIAFADDGSLWFTETNADNVGRYDPASGTFTEYPLETPGAIPFDITEGPDGKIYFTELGTGRIGQLDPAKAPIAAPNASDGVPEAPFAQQGRCEIPGIFICQQQINLTGSTFRIGDALTQVLPPETLTLTAGISFNDPNGMVPPVSGPMLESRPVDVEVGGQQAVTRVGLAGPPILTSILPIDVTVPIDLYVSQPGNPEGGCVIGPVVQHLQSAPDDEGDMGALLAGDYGAIEGGGSAIGVGTLADTTFEVPAARGCGALTSVINTLLELPSPSGSNAIELPFTQLLTPPGS
jgi:virginiamycin B lyase